jgi:hypothetical protein
MTMRSVVALRPGITTDDRKLLELFDSYRSALVKHWNGCVELAGGYVYGTLYTFHAGFRRYDVLPDGQLDMFVHGQLRLDRSVWHRAVHQIFGSLT